MKYFTAFLTAALLSITAVFSQEDIPLASISFEETTHDFGSFAESMGNVTCSFTFSNTSNVPLIITRASASCGCTTPEFTKEPIAPGATGEIKVTYKAQGRPGAFQKNVYVYANTDPEKSTLVIQGDVVPTQTQKNPTYGYAINDLKLKSTHIPFFDVYAGQPKVEKISVISESDMPMPISFDKVPRHLSVEMVPATLEPGAKGEIIVTYKAEIAKDWGIRKDDFYLIMPGLEKNSPLNKLTVSANIREDYSSLTPEQRANAPKLDISESKLDFGIIKGNEPITKTIILTNSGKSNLQIRKINNESSVIDAKVKKMSIKPGKTAELYITIYPEKSKSKIINHRIFIITNDPNRPTVSVPVLGTFQ